MHFKKIATQKSNLPATLQYNAIKVQQYNALQKYDVHIIPFCWIDQSHESLWKLGAEALKHPFRHLNASAKTLPSCTSQNYFSFSPSILYLSKGQNNFTFSSFILYLATGQHYFTFSHFTLYLAKGQNYFTFSSILKWAIISKSVRNWRPKMPKTNFNKVLTLWTCQIKHAWKTCPQR